MSNIIDSIQLSGTVYTLSAQTGGGGVPESTFTAYTASTDSRISIDEEVTAAGLNALNEKIEDLDGTATVELTQAEYDALVTAGTVSADTYYIISDATPVDMSNYYTTGQTNTLLAGKQDTLVSSSNIKTINNESILGSGNIDIQGGSTYTAGRGIDITNDTISFSLPISAGTASYSIAEGYNAQANGPYSHAEGANTKANGNYSHAEGQNTTASGGTSHAEGYYSKANGPYSHAEGFGAKANGIYSHAEGGATNANGANSHSEGDTTTAKGNCSHTEGWYTIANNHSEHSSGQYNNSVSATTTFGDSGNTLFSVGNGASESTRHNTFEIRQNGDIYIADTNDVSTTNWYEKPMIKLQDQLGGSSITVDTALSSTSENPVQNKVIYNKIDEVEQVTAAGLNALNDKIGDIETLLSQI